MSNSYQEFLESKTQLGGDYGFEPRWMHPDLFGFQVDLVAWALRKGRAAIFADCGMGKTPIQLVWAENVARHTGKKILILTPLAVSYQTLRESEKFGINAAISRDGKISNNANVIITNYERLHYFDSSDFVAAVCDESSILKNFDGATRSAITQFMLKLPYRLLCTATAAPNDYIELGTSSEALGELGYIDMLHRFFKANDNSYAQGGGAHSRTRFHGFDGKFRFRGHAERDFWRWVCSWARAVRKPSDMGFDDGAFLLPDLITREHIVEARAHREGMLFDIPAVGLQEQREERRRTLNERCEMAAQIAENTEGPVVSWCHLNSEGDLLTNLIPDAVQIAGRDTDERKEEVFMGFAGGDIRRIVTKPTIAGFGLNWQHCSSQTFFPSHSFEQWYQAVRRSWRFGQKNTVTVDVIASEGERGVLRNLQRKQGAADKMFKHLVDLMNDELRVDVKPYTGMNEEVPTWL